MGTLFLPYLLSQSLHFCVDVGTLFDVEGRRNPRMLWHVILSSLASLGLV
jgi:hypothetical protein